MNNQNQKFTDKNYTRLTNQLLAPQLWTHDEANLPRWIEKMCLNNHLLSQRTHTLSTMTPRPQQQKPTPHTKWTYKPLSSSNNIHLTVIRKIRNKNTMNIPNENNSQTWDPCCTVGIGWLHRRIWAKKQSADWRTAFLHSTFTSFYASHLFLHLTTHICAFEGIYLFISSLFAFDWTANTNFSKILKNLLVVNLFVRFSWSMGNSLCLVNLEVLLVIGMKIGYLRFSFFSISGHRVTTFNCVTRGYTCMWWFEYRYACYLV